MKAILEQLDEAEKAANPWPWAAGNEAVWNVWPEGECNSQDCIAEFVKDNDAKLIALMRNYIRNLLDVAKAAENYVKSVQWDGQPDHDEYDDIVKALAKLNGGDE